MSQPVLRIQVGLGTMAKEDAIRRAAELLHQAGCVPAAYADSMFRREKTANTFLGNGLAIPHGELADKGLVARGGLAFLQIPGGVDWGNGNRATLVVGIAAASDAHTDILSRLADIVTDETALAMLNATADPEAIRAALLSPAPAATAEADDAGDYPEAIEWTVDYPAGLHVRPAAVWVDKARAAGVPLRVRLDGRCADPRSLVALLRLGARAGSVLTISAAGPDAGAALARFHQDIAALSAGEQAQAERAAARSGRVSLRAWTPARIDPVGVVDGVAASPGLAIGVVHRPAPAVLEIPDIPAPLLEGGTALETALDRARLQLRAVADDAARRLGPADAAIFTAQAALLDDEALIAGTCRLLVLGHGAAWAWHHSVEQQAGELAASGDPLLAARAADLRDVGLRVLVLLAPELEAKPASRRLPDNTVVIAPDLSPSDTAALDSDRVVGLATALGGPTSHTAIVARTLGLAAVVAAGDRLLGAREGSEVIIDGDGGRVWVDPSPAALAAAREEMARRAAERSRQAASRALPAETTDGRRIEVAANINTPDQAALAFEMGAEAVGLMRTEFLFLEKGASPDEDEQHAIYRAMAQAVAGRRLVIRALDIGGDKQVPHLDLPRENNPFLGVRGSRLLLRRPDLLTPQLRALYRAARESANIAVMFPMVTTVNEVLELTAFCEDVRAGLDAPAIPLGIMIEVPAAAALADLLARHVAFFSVGTNDLTQYTLAMDRQNPGLALEADGFHPAVLRMIRLTVEGAARHGRPVGVCGGIAGEPAGAALLAGMGVDELSMTPRDIPAVKDALRGRSHAELRGLAEKALDMETAEQVHDLLDAAFPPH